MPGAGLIVAQVFHGLVLGGMLALVGSGLTVILGTLGLVNFAHGAFFTFAAYAGWLVWSATGSYLAALVVGPLVTCALGLLLERTLIRRFYGRPHEDQILLTFGLGIVIVEALRWVFGGVGKTLPVPDALAGASRLGPILYPDYRLVVFAIAAAALLACWLVLYHSRLGLIVRAAIEDTVMVRILGLRASRIRALVFGLGILAVGLAGVVLGPIVSIAPDTGERFMVLSFVVVVIGGLGSFPGAILGGLIAGQIQTLTSIVNPAWSDLMLFVVMVLILAVRPRGLLGVEGRS
ncbi:MAG TPA: branched-chain amino acid ABC transporter permease [Burkholderiaceae bacterium]|jgi:branched-chain amino acid transport system permease protein|nr:branched-chain amino acid ABC transporter permease [Burkholderiaceae bacterium]